MNSIKQLDDNVKIIPLVRLPQIFSKKVQEFDKLLKNKSLDKYNSSDLGEYLEIQKHLQKVKEKENQKIAFYEKNLDHTLSSSQSLGPIMLKKLRNKFGITKDDIVQSKFDPYQAKAAYSDQVEPPNENY